jgi:hypothetical protein
VGQAGAVWNGRRHNVKKAEKSSLGPEFRLDRLKQMLDVEGFL